MIRRHYSLIVIPVLLLCAPRLERNNPYDADFTGGDYQLNASWSPDGDSFQVFFPCTLTCTNSGDDEFVEFTVSEDPEGFCTHPDKGPRQFDEKLTFTFNQTGTGTFIIRAVRPNGSTDTFYDTITVFNPYRVLVDSGSIYTGKNIRFYVKNGGDFSDNDTTLTVSWYIDSLLIGELPAGDTLSLPVSRPGTVTVRARLSYGSFSIALPDPDTVNAGEEKIPTVTLAENVIYVPVGDPAKISAKMNNADILVWKGRLINATTTVPFLSAVWNDTIDDTLIVTAKNRFNTVGTSDTAIIKPRTFCLSLEKISFPDTAIARRPNEWKVRVSKDNVAVPDDSVTYVWECEPAVFDSSDTSGGTLRLFFDNENDSFELSVHAFSNSDTTCTTWMLEETVSVLANRPVLRILSYDDSVAQDDTARIVIEYHDVDEDSSVDSVFYFSRFIGDTLRLPGGKSGKDTIRIIMTAPGDQGITFWCRDDEGFLSDKVTATVKVSSEYPHIIHISPDTAVYINDAVRISAPADPGSKGDSIVTWYWDIGGGTRIDSTTVDHIDTVFTSAGTVSISVNCRNEVNETARENATFEITVREGRPEVLSVGCDDPYVFVNDSAAIRITAADSNGTIQSLLVSINGDTALYGVEPSDTVDATMMIAMNDTGRFLIAAAAIDDDSIRSSFSSTEITVREGRPRVLSVGCDDPFVYAHDSAAIRITAADSNGTIQALSVSVNGDTTLFAVEPSDTVDTTIVIPVPDAGHYIVTASAMDDDSLLSPFTSMEDSLDVRVGYPIAMEITPDTCWMLHNTDFIIWAADSGATTGISQFFIEWEQDSGTDTVATGNVSHRYASSGKKVRHATVMDNEGNVSETFTDTVTVLEGRPEVTDVTVDTAADSIYINDTREFTIAANDPNPGGSIARWAIRWHADGSFTEQTSPEFSHEYHEPGVYTVTAYAIDNDSLTSPEDSIQVTVLPGEPEFVSVTTSPEPTDIYIMDEITFTVTGSDENGPIEKVAVRWKEGDSYEEFSASDDSAVFTHRFARADSGDQTIVIRVYDDDGQYDRSEYTVPVRSGAPSVTGAWCEEDPVWVNDVNTYRVRATDSNGFIKKVYVDWSGGSIPDSTISLDGDDHTVAVTFDHAYDTTETGTQEPGFWVTDEDTVPSSIRDTTFSVRLGAPVLSGDSEDTLWVVVDDGPSKEYPLDLTDNAYDSNGVDNIPVRYYLNEGSVFDSTSASARNTSDGDTSWYVREDDLHESVRVQVRVLDDDGLLRGGTYWIYADSAPPRPEPISVSQTPGVDSVKLSWEKSDEKDGDATLFSIICDTDNPPTTAIKDFQTFPKDGNRYYFWFHPPSTPSPATYRYRVIARDSRGTESESLGSTAFDYTAPE